METASRLPYRGGKVVTGKPGRNIWCPEYDDCLSKAAKFDLPMDCGGCPMGTVKMPVFVLTLCEIEGCKALVEAIFSREPDFI